MFRVLSLCKCIFMVLMSSYMAKAQQDSRVLSLYDRLSYEYIRQLQDRGHLLELHPTDMPYRYDELRDALAGAVVHNFTGVYARWIRYLQDRVGLIDTERSVLDLRGASYLQANNSKRGIICTDLVMILHICI